MFALPLRLLLVLHVETKRSRKVLRGVPEFGIWTMLECHFNITCRNIHARPHHLDTNPWCHFYCRGRSIQACQVLHLIQIHVFSVPQDCSWHRDRFQLFLHRLADIPRAGCPVHRGCTSTGTPARGVPLPLVLGEAGIQNYHRRLNTFIKITILNNFILMTSE